MDWNLQPTVRYHDAVLGIPHERHKVSPIRPRDALCALLDNRVPTSRMSRSMFDTSPVALFETISHIAGYVLIGHSSTLPAFVRSLLSPFTLACSPSFFYLATGHQTSPRGPVAFSLTLPFHSRVACLSCINHPRLASAGKANLRPRFPPLRSRARRLKLRSLRSPSGRCAEVYLPAVARLTTANSPPPPHSVARS